MKSNSSATATRSTRPVATARIVGSKALTLAGVNPTFRTSLILVCSGGSSEPTASASAPRHVRSIRLTSSGRETAERGLWSRAEKFWSSRSTATMS